LGNALRTKGDLDGAIAQFREAIRLDPKYVWNRINLGNALRKKGDLDGAIAQFGEAIRLDPKSTWNRIHLGNALLDKGDLGGAIAQYREAIRLDPKLGDAHNSLGWALYGKGDLDGAIAQYQEAIRLDPKHRHALANLPRAKRMRALLPRLADVLAGKDKPKSPAETYALGELCYAPFQSRYADAVRLFAEAFAADPKLADDFKSGNRYNAACVAALAGCGKGQDAARQDDKARARLREQALTWLRADLVLLRQQARSGESAAALAHWLEDPDLAGVRPGPKQVAMPAVERAAWDTLWADVKATLALVQKAVPASQGK
jgi:tetratricopeptide (TPR) repeat protein